MASAHLERCVPSSPHLFFVCTVRPSFFCGYRLGYVPAQPRPAAGVGACFFVHSPQEFRARRARSKAVLLRPTLWTPSRPPALSHFSGDGEDQGSFPVTSATVHSSAPGVLSLFLLLSYEHVLPRHTRKVWALAHMSSGLHRFRLGHLQVASLGAAVYHSCGVWSATGIRK